MIFGSYKKYQAMYIKVLKIIVCFCIAFLPWESVICNFPDEMFDKIPVNSLLLPVKKENGKAFLIDIASLNLSLLSDSNERPYRSPLIIIQKSKKLTGHALHDQIRNENGLYSHWGNYIYISPLKTKDKTNIMKEIIILAPPAWLYYLKIISWVVLLVGTIALILFAINKKIIITNKDKVYLLLAVLVGFSFYVYANWNSLIIAPDSFTYIRPFDAGSTRTSGYPLFITAVSLGENRNLKAGSIKINSPLRPSDIKKQNRFLLDIVRTQEIIFLGSVTICCLALMNIIQPYLIPPTFLFLAESGLLNQYGNAILTESVTQSLILVLFASAAAFFIGNKYKYLISASLLVCMCVMVRPDNVYTISSLLFMALVYLKNKGISVSGCIKILIAIILPVAIILGAMTYRYANKKGIIVTPQYASAKIATALELAKHSDIDIMPDKETKKFLKNALERKMKIDKNMESKGINVSDPDGIYQKNKIFKLINSQEIAKPLAVEMGYKKDSIEYYDLFIKVSDPILKKYYLRLIVMSAKTMAVAMFDNSLLNKKINIWIICGIILVLSFRSNVIVLKLCYLSFALHFGHILIIGLYGVPLSRLLYPTEWMLITCAILVCACICFRFLSKQVGPKPSIIWGKNGLVF